MENHDKSQVGGVKHLVVAVVVVMMMMIVMMIMLRGFESGTGYLVSRRTL